MPDFPDDISNHRICQLHFDLDDLKLARGELQLRFGAIPKRFPGCVTYLHSYIRVCCVTNEKSFQCFSLRLLCLQSTDLR